jgi:fission process protein 1
MAKDNKTIEEVNGVPAERQGTRPDFSTPPLRKRLPKEIQDNLNDEEKLWEVLYDGEYVQRSNFQYINSTSSAMRATFK